MDYGSGAQCIPVIKFYVSVIVCMYVCIICVLLMFCMTRVHAAVT